MPIVRNELQSLSIQTDTGIERRAVRADDDRGLFFVRQAESYLKRTFYVLESSAVMSILSLHVNKDV